MLVGAMAGNFGKPNRTETLKLHGFRDWLPERFTIGEPWFIVLGKPATRSVLTVTKVDRRRGVIVLDSKPRKQRRRA